MKMDGLELHFFVLGKPKERLEKSSMKGEAFSLKESITSNTWMAERKRER